MSDLDLAFSCDRFNKFYVQDCMIHKKEQLFSWLQEGAYFFVCGDKEYMAKDGVKTLCHIVQNEGKMNHKQAESYVNNLKKEKRYVMDVY